LAAVFLSAAVTCFASLFLGQAALRLAGAREWSWLAPAVGLSLAMLLATPTAHVPGRATTLAVLLALLSATAAVWCLLSPPHRPPWRDLLAAAPVALLVAVPFLAAGRGGILGVTVDNDMSAHLVFVEGFLSSQIASVNPLPSDYPLGPHALAALLARGLGIHSETAFSGWTMAIPVLNGWIALAVARRASWFGKAVLATVVGIPFLIAAYYGEGSFKELALAGLVLAFVLVLAGCGPRLGRGRWVPVALLVGGIASVFSLPGLPWLLLIGGLWVAGLLAIEIRRGGLREVRQAVRRELPALGVGLAVLVVLLLPQAARLWSFLSQGTGTGIEPSNLGNLLGPLPGWEALGVWNQADFRLPTSWTLAAGLWTAFALALVLFGAYWACRRGRWLLPLAAGAAVAIWLVSNHSQSPYVSAKALVVASPLLLLLAVLPLADPGPLAGRGRRSQLAMALLGLVLLLGVGAADLRALRFSPVGPTDHARQLESFRPLIAGEPTLYIGADEFIRWELASAPALPASYATIRNVPMRRQKQWEYGQAMDFDLIPAATLDEYDWVVTSRDPAASAPPPQFRLARSTADFRLWKRTGPVREHSILGEGEWSGAILDCGTAGGRAILAAGGVAAVRPVPRVAPLGLVGAGGTLTARIDPPPGTYRLALPYESPYPVDVEAPGLHVELPANLERLGPRFPAGRLVVADRRPRTVSLHVDDTALAPAGATATFTSLVIVPAAGSERIVPIRRACGKYVDWYRSTS
jgi:hypothetical protein